MEILKEKIIGSLKGKGIKIVFVLGIVGILLIFLSSFIPKTDKSEDKATTQNTAEVYRKGLEETTARLVRSITGNKRVSVMITLDTGTQYIYADDSSKESSDGKSRDSHNYKVIRSDDGGEKGLVKTEYLPVVRGVAVVCDASSAAQIEEIKRSVTAALDISSKKIYVTQYSY